MKTVLLFVVTAFALLGVSPAQPAAADSHAPAVTVAAAQVAPAAARPAADVGAKEGVAAGQDDKSAPVDASTYALLALGLFGMGLVSRRRQPE